MDIADYLEKEQVDQVLDAARRAATVTICCCTGF
jgi:hypothetical protein